MKFSEERYDKISKTCICEGQLRNGICSPNCDKLDQIDRFIAGCPENWKKKSKSSSVDHLKHDFIKVFIFIFHFFLDFFLLNKILKNQSPGTWNIFVSEIRYFYFLIAKMVQKSKFRKILPVFTILLLLFLYIKKGIENEKNSSKMKPWNLRKK